MHIARFAGIHIRKDDSPAVIEKMFAINDTHIYVNSVGNENVGQNYRAVAVRKFHPTDLNILELANEQRRICESSIEHIANVLSITACSDHLILSEQPIIAFRPDKVEEEKYIEQLLSKYGYAGSSRWELGKLVLGDIGSLLDVLNDRTNGVAAMSAALNCTTKLSQYRELVRFFEIAFRIPFVQIDKKLSQFLSQAKYEIERSEIKIWGKFRHPSIHGDGAISQEIVFELDVAPCVERMKMAALDVLFNKLKWGSKDTSRRMKFELPGFSKDGDKLIAGNNYIQARAVMMDQFNVWSVKSPSVDAESLKSNGWRFTPLKYANEAKDGSADT